MEWVHCHIARKPVPPSERLENVPAPVSAIIMKLLAKTAEERYQTAGGVERDLRRCLAAWEARGDIDDCPLGQQDTPDRLLIPEKLYGRAREVGTLLAAFDRIVRSGAPELVLVSGYACAPQKFHPISLDSTPLSSDNSEGRQPLPRRSTTAMMELPRL